MSDDRHVFTVTGNGNGTLRLVGELDATTVPALTDALAARRGDAADVLDLSGLTFIDSSGLHAIEDYAQSGEREGLLTLTGASPHLMRLFEITSLTTHPNIRIDGGA
jgi:anti-anti-sigma factor